MSGFSWTVSDFHFRRNTLKSGFGRVSRLELRWERIVSHQRTLIWLRCDGSGHWIIEQPQSFHCLRIRFDSLSFPVALSTIDDWVTLEVHYPLWPTLRLSDSLVYCRQLPWNLLGYFSVLNIHRVPDVPEQAIALSPPAFNIHWIPDVPEEAIRLSPPRTFTEFWHVFVRSVWWNISKLRLWLRHYRVPPRARF